MTAATGACRGARHWMACVRFVLVRFFRYALFLVRGLYQAALFTASTLREGEYGDRLGLMSVCTLDNRRHIMRLRHNGGSGLADCTLDTAAEA